MEDLVIITYDTGYIILFIFHLNVATVRCTGNQIAAKSKHYNLVGAAELIESYFPFMKSFVLRCCFISTLLCFTFMFVNFITVR